MKRPAEVTEFLRCGGPNCNDACSSQFDKLGVEDCQTWRVHGYVQQLEKRVIHLGALNQSNLTTITMQERTRARLQEQISQLEADNDRLTDEVCNAYNIRNEQLARIKQLEAELEDMTARYKIADDCTKKKGEMNEKLYAELSAVKAERDAAVADLKDCVTEAAQGDDFDCCFACKYNNEYGGCDRPNYTIEACGVEDFDNKWTWRGVQKGKCDV